MNFTTHRRTICHSLALATATTLAPFMAPLQVNALEEVIVTAQRREQSLQDVATSISAFSAEAIETQQIEDMADLQFSVPNLLADGLRLSIRGVGNNAISSTAEDGLGYHVNDVYVNTPLFATSEYYDIERLEILRGPQGTLYGRNTTAGVINIHTRKPHDELGGFVSGTLGNFDTQRLKGAINLPVSDKGRQRFAGFYNKRDGYTKNQFTGNRVDGRDSYELRSSTSIDFTDNLASDLVVSYVKEDSDRSFRTKGTCTKDPEIGCSPLSSGFETPDVSGSIFQTVNGLVFRGGLLPAGDYFADSDNPNSFRTVNMDQEPTYETEQVGISLEFNYQLGQYKLTSLTGYYDTEADVFFDFDRFTTDVRLTSPVTYRADARNFITTDMIVSGRRFLSEAEQFTQEFRIASEYDGRFNFLFGAFYFDEEAESQTLITHPVLAAAQQAQDLSELFEMFRVDTDPVKTESLALFGEAYFEVTEQARVTVGLRYTDDKKESRSRQVFLTLSDPAWVEAEDDWQEVTGKVVGEYSLSEDSLLFASFSRGYKAGGLNPGGPAGGETFEPEFINAIEIGSKNLFADGQVQANFGVFYYDYEDMQIGQINETSAITVNGDAEVMGAEAEFAYAPSDAWLFDLNLAWLDFEIQDFESADEGDPNGIAPGTTPALDENGEIRFTDRGLLIKDLEGNSLRNAPEYSLKVGAQYTHVFDCGYDLSGRVDYFWQDDYYATEFNKPAGQIDGWEQLNLQATLQPSGSNWLVRAYVKNALDNDDVTRMEQQGTLVGLFRDVTVLEPRTYGVEFQMFFE
ncbi:MAG: TonB-dependent receptor [Halioglobus sp.]|nr:TonB-dependent receptor [Halioglobus sp.]